MNQVSIALDCRYISSANARLDTWKGLPRRMEVNQSIFTPTHLLACRTFKSIKGYANENRPIK